MSDTPRYEKVSDTQGEDPVCSFCGRKRSEVKMMFRSDDARICNLCIANLKQNSDTPQQ